MKTNFFKSLLVIVGVLFSMTASAYDVEVDGIYYNILQKTKEAEVTYKGEYWFSVKTYSGKVIIPETITYKGDTYSVTSDLY